MPNYRIFVHPLLVLSRGSISVSERSDRKYQELYHRILSKNTIKNNLFTTKITDIFSAHLFILNLHKTETFSKPAMTRIDVP